MKALVYRNGQIALEQVEKPVMPQGGALARILTAAVCGTDIRTFRFGNKELAHGRVIGHEACYLLEEIDPAITDFKKGDRVIIAPAIGCGVCASCRKGHTNTCEEMVTIGFQSDGTFAEYCPIPAQAFAMGNVIKIPDSLSDAEAAVVEPIACIINGQSFLNIEKGDNVLVYGAGYIGCVHAELARIKGADKVILADISAKRRDQAQKLTKGITIMDSSAPDFFDKAQEVAGSSGINVAITACPAGAAQREALKIVYKHGRISLFGGLPGEPVGFLDSNLIHYKELGVFGVHASTPQQNREALKLVSESVLNVKKYLTEYPLDQVEEAIESLKAEDTLKAVLK